ncbi:MAG: phenylalanine--tRNA ligase subunit alpha [Actinomycetes bacterium]|jgi:phenylalanyl-tRNA synthetase alpha chain|nr:phenylalanine--tRNA ligase subunit alpha [Actinomycetes bacterium]
MSLIEQLTALGADGLASIAAADSAAALDAARVDLLGKKGRLTGILRGLGALPADERPAVGAAANRVRTAIEDALTTRKAALDAAALDAQLAAGTLDITLPGRARPIGAQHLISRIRDEIVEVFCGIGYTVAEGPEVELDFYNFTALNHEPQHPARSASDTFYVVDRSTDAETWTGPEPSDVLMRTHTSPVQIRTMEHTKPPIYILAPGKVYRRDVPDPTHLPQFTQMEGLVVDRDVTFADLRGTLDYLCREIFGSQVRTRFRPHFFPFTEPSAEVDVSCNVCGGTGCRTCKGTGWIEILGCGMVDPNVFAAVGLDPEEWSGFAFGLGIDRIAALRYDLPDIRMLVEGDMRFLRQF